MQLPRCQFCKRQLSADESVKNGIGPECATRRTQLFGSIGTSETEIARLVALGDETIARWIKNFGKAVANQDKKYAKIYIDAARRAAIRLKAEQTALILN